MTEYVANIKALPAIGIVTTEVGAVDRLTVKLPVTPPMAATTVV